MTVISIIIVTYNNEATIYSCLHSLHDAIPPGMQEDVILIDNKSTDGTVAVIKDFYGTMHRPVRMRLIENQNNILFSPAVDQGLRMAAGRYIMLLNPDTRLTAGSIEILVATLENNDRIGLAGPQFISSDGVVQASCRRFPNHAMLLWELTGLSKIFPRSPVFAAWKMGDFDHLTSRTVDQPMGACLLARREHIDRIGGMDERFPMFFNDVDWCRRFMEHGYVNYYESAANIYHQAGHSVYQRRARMIVESHIGFYRYLEKYRKGWGDGLLNWLFLPFLMASAFVRIVFWKLFGGGRNGDVRTGKDGG